jgi:hypothetical protein
MGPIALFDKSFLQSLSTDEALWFDHFFMPIVCPVFIWRRSATLQKRQVTGGRQMLEADRATLGPWVG